MFNTEHLNQQALFYSKKAIGYALRTGNYEGACLDYANAAYAISKDSTKNDTVKAYLFKALYYGKKSGNAANIDNAFHSIADFYLSAKNYSEAELYADTACAISKKLGSNYDLLGSDLVLRGIINLHLKNFTQAAEDCNNAIPIIRARKDWKSLSTAYNNLAAISEQNKNWQQAYKYMQLYTAFKDSIFNRDISDKLQEVEAKYNDEKKEQQISSLQKESEIQNLTLNRRMMILYSLGSGLLALLIIIFLLNKNLQRRKQLAHNEQQLHTQKIKELEQEKQLIATNSLLKGQEEERGRVAKDLHDGLGGMLYGIKLTLHAMKGNVILSADNAYLFSKTVEQLDSSISEMRRVAHNMMPEALVKFGLAQALQDYCDGINETGQLNCVLQLYGLEKRLDTTTEVVVYRIIQELLNNVMKHAKATEVVVQLIRNDDKINITVEDNGSGFKADETSINKGAGLSNVRSRVSYLRGTMEVESALGKGTSVHIDNLTDNGYE